MERIYSFKPYDFKKALPFTNEEFKKIKAVKGKNWHMENRIDYDGKSFIYVYELTNIYSSHLLNIYKFDNCFIIDNVCAMHINSQKCYSIAEIINYLKDYINV